MTWQWPWTRTPATPEPTDLSLTEVSPWISMMLGYTPGEIGSVTESTAMTLSAVYRAVSLVSGALGSLPLRTLRTAQDGTRTRAGSCLDNPGLDRWTPFEWKELATVYLLLGGAAPLQHVYGGGGQLVGLNPIHPGACHVEAADVPGGRQITVDLGDGTTREFDARTMTYIPGLSLDGIVGLSCISAARLSLSTGLSGDKAANRMFSNGAMVSGLVTPEEDLEEGEAREIKEMVNRSMTGTENAGDIAVINRKLKFTPWTMNASDAQFIESRSFSIDEVGRWFGVPPHLLGLTEKATSWGQGIAEQNRGLARYTLMPWTTRIEQRLSRLISGSTIVEFDYSQFVAPSPETEIALLLDQVNGGLITPNEARRIRNLPPIAGADELRPPGPSAPDEPPAQPPAAREVLTVLSRLVADWDEDKHPRRDDGKFGHGYGAEDDYADKWADDHGFAESRDLSAADVAADWKDRVSPDLAQRQALNAWTGPQYYFINRYVREGDDELGGKAQEHAEQITALMGQYRLPGDLKAFRMLGGDVVPPESQVGKLVVSPGFSAVAVDAPPGGSFEREEMYPVVMEVTVPEGSHGVSVEGSGFGMPGEREFLLPHNTRFAVYSDRKEGGRRHLGVVAMPPKPQEAA